MLYTKKANLLSQIGLPVNGEYVLLPGSNPLSESLIKFLRIFCMDQHEVDSFLGVNTLFDVKSTGFGKGPGLRRRELEFLMNRLELLAKNCISKMVNISSLFRITIETHHESNHMISTSLIIFETIEVISLGILHNNPTIDIYNTNDIEEMTEL